MAQTGRARVIPQTEQGEPSTRSQGAHADVAEASGYAQRAYELRGGRGLEQLIRAWQEDIEHALGQENRALVTYATLLEQDIEEANKKLAEIEKDRQFVHLLQAQCESCEIELYSTQIKVKDAQGLAATKAAQLLQTQAELVNCKAALEAAQAELSRAREERAKDCARMQELEEALAAVEAKLQLRKANIDIPASPAPQLPRASAPTSRQPANASNDPVTQTKHHVDPASPACATGALSPIQEQSTPLDAAQAARDAALVADPASPRMGRPSVEAEDDSAKRHHSSHNDPPEVTGCTPPRRRRGGRTADSPPRCKSKSAGGVGGKRPTPATQHQRDVQSCHTRHRKARTQAQRVAVAVAGHSSQVAPAVDAAGGTNHSHGVADIPGALAAADWGTAATQIAAANEQLHEKENLAPRALVFDAGTANGHKTNEGAAGWTQGVQATQHGDTFHTPAGAARQEGRGGEQDSGTAAAGWLGETTVQRAGNSALRAVSKVRSVFCQQDANVGPEMDDMLVMFRNNPGVQHDVMDSGRSDRLRLVHTHAKSGYSWCTERHFSAIATQTGSQAPESDQVLFRVEKLGNDESMPHAFFKQSFIFTADKKRDVEDRLAEHLGLKPSH